MQIGIFGSGVVGQVLAARLIEVGQEVMIGTRDVAALLGRQERAMGMNQTFAEWHAQNPRVQLGTFAEAAGFGEVLLNATAGTASLEVLRLAGAEKMNGKLLMDISNPLDFSRGMPPALSVCNTDSVAEQLQRAFPDVRVVKTLNTVTAMVMAYPERVAEGDHDMFVAGNDMAAKAQATELLKSWFGWKHVVHLGGIVSARGMEMYLPIWLSLWGALQTPMFNVKVVR